MVTCSHQTTRPTQIDGFCNQIPGRKQTNSLRQRTVFRVQSVFSQDSDYDRDPHLYIFEKNILFSAGNLIAKIVDLTRGREGWWRPSRRPPRSPSHSALGQWTALLDRAKVEPLLTSPTVETFAPPRPWRRPPPCSPPHWPRRARCSRPRSRCRAAPDPCFRVHIAGFRVHGAGCRFKSAGFRVQGSG